MSTSSAIEWTEHTWNPTTGCTKVSSGCQNCYAETMARRLKAIGVKGYENGFKLSLQPGRLQQPLKRKKPTLYFVNSMSDIFHEDIPDSYIREVFDIIKKAQQHTFQVLTKRAIRMAQFLRFNDAPENLWIGVTVENKRHGVPRIDILRNVRAHIRFLSMEPLLEDLGDLDLTNIQWVIVGGESGPKARLMKPEWVKHIKQQCEKYNISFFFKQWGCWGVDGKKRSKKLNGRLLLGRTWDYKPTFFN
ncbi:MAG: phage Gp37/Gp68 family protein [Deltaproteobacteria bacterium]|nr:phage Gp37/Gp68 family protein [Deltaproteobacteria bacterium]